MCKRFILFLVGVAISLLFAIAAFVWIFFAESVSWENATLVIALCAMPTIFLGFPYLNSLFEVSVENGKLNIKEERGKQRGNGTTIRKINKD